MARAYHQRRNHSRYEYRMPVNGSEAIQPVLVPRRKKTVRPEREVLRQPQKKTSARVRENRRRALAVDRGYVGFLMIMSAICVGMCIYYLQLCSLATSQLETNSKLESELTTLKSENDALYENITNSVDLSAVREYAMNELGMKYADEDQIIWYNTEGSEYVRQYQEVPSGE